MPESSASVVIRRAIATDGRGVLDCLAAAFAPYRAQYTLAAYLDTVLTTETILLRLQAMHVLVAVTPDNQIIGAIACSQANPIEGHLRGMAVIPQWQGRGIAEKLLRAAEAELVQRGCSRITLDTTEPLLRAMRFYEHHGYRSSGRTSDFFGMQLHEYVKEF